MQHSQVRPGYLQAAHILHFGEPSSHKCKGCSGGVRKTFPCHIFPIYKVGGSCNRCSHQSQACTLREELTQMQKKMSEEERKKAYRKAVVGKLDDLKKDDWAYLGMEDWLKEELENGESEGEEREGKRRRIQLSSSESSDSSEEEEVEEWNGFSLEEEEEEEWAGIQSEEE